MNHEDYDDEDNLHEFDPRDMEEMNKRFEALIKQSTEEYVVEFRISKLGAKELISEWFQALVGAEEPIKKCFREYSHIMEELMVQMQNDPD